MPKERQRIGTDAERMLFRRAVLTTATTFAAALGGCSDGRTEREFEATPVGLPEDGRQEVVLGESGRTSALRTRSNGGPKLNEPTTVTPTRRDGAMFEDLTTPMQGSNHSRGEKPWT
jgi:hypothetical protein